MAEIHRIQPRYSYRALVNVDNYSDEQIVQKIRSLPPDLDHLTLEEYTPSEIWSLLSDRLSCVKYLRLSAGWSEMLSDNIPIHWPLETLVVDSSGGELVQTPWVIEGRAKHLVLYLTSGLRFGGPTNEELRQRHYEAVERGGKEAIILEDSDEGICEFVSFPELVEEDRQNRWTDQAAFEVTEDGNAVDGSLGTATNMATLEIIENDAMYQFVAMAIGCNRVIQNIKTLNIRSSQRFAQDFHVGLQPCMFRQVLRLQKNLRTLVLTLGDGFHDRDYLPTLYQNFPPNLETLRLRSSVVLAKPATIERWKSALADKTFLPNLRRLSFILDLPDWEQERLASEKFKRDWETRDYEEAHGEENFASADLIHGHTETEMSSATLEDNDIDYSNYGQGTSNSSIAGQQVSADQLRVAKKACEEIWAIAESRGITVEPFEEKWSDEFRLAGPDYERWDALQ